MADAPQGLWKEAKDQLGRTYYYHTVTKQSRWELPPGAVLAPASAKSHNQQPAQQTQPAQQIQPQQVQQVHQQLQQLQLQQQQQPAAIEPAPISRPASLSVVPLNRAPSSLSTPRASVAQRAIVDDPWVECREVVSGRTLYYHSRTREIVFDVKPSYTNSPDRRSSDRWSPSTPSSLSMSSIMREIQKEEEAPQQQMIDPDWELSNDGTWYNKKTFETRSADDPPYLQAGAQLEEKKDGVEEDDPVSAAEKLCDFKSTGWDFTNPRCEQYRAEAARVPHHNFRPQIMDLECPRYFSTSPIPPLPNNSFTCQIKLPEQFLKNKAMSSTKVFCRMNDTVQAAIEQALKKCQDNLEPSHFVLKVVGRAEYLYGAAKVIDFEYVRYCIRHQMDVVLALVYMPVVVPKFDVRFLEPSPYERRYEEMPVLEADDYKDLSLKAGVAKPNSHSAFQDWNNIPLSELKWPYRLRINDIDNISTLPRWGYHIESILVKTELFHGDKSIKSSQLVTRPSPFVETPYWFQWLAPNNYSLLFANLPRETRLVIAVYGMTVDRKEILLAYVNQQLIDELGHLISGTRQLRLWGVPDVKEDPNFSMQGPTWENLSSDQTATLTLQFDEFPLPVVAPLYPAPVPINEMQVGPKIALNLIPKPTMSKLEAIATSDPLKQLTEEERNLLWTYRHHFTARSSCLPKFLQTVDWTDKQKTAEAHRLLRSWALPTPYEAFELLDIRYPDTLVRQYAVDCLRNLSDSDLAELLLQFVQTLKFEPYHNSAVARFLLERCLRNPYQLGHYFFWHLKAEMHNKEFCERYGLLMEEYLKHAGNHAVELQTQNKIVKRLLEIADLIIKYKNVNRMNDDQCKAELRKELTALNGQLPAVFQIPLNPRWQAKRIKPEKCKYMSSKKIPLWLVFQNADDDGPDIYTIFKSGDDLRQDILTLQLLRLMDKVWLSEGLDLRLKPYSVIATGVNPENEGVGMIEIVLNSDTISNIQIKYGGGALGALRLSPLHDFIREKNSDETRYQEAVENFCRSVAGYCVATFVLGIGDRHNGNIMLTESGHLFHIDFGHFLGNFKKKFGFNRERSPFVFTPEMAYVMGGEDYKRSQLYLNFVDSCCRAYNILRKNSNLFIDLFILMQSAGMPELQCFEDIEYLRDMLKLQLSDSDASKQFVSEIKSSVTEKWRRIDNAIHNARHG